MRQRWRAQIRQYIIPHQGEKIKYHMVYILGARTGVQVLPSCAARAPPADPMAGHCRAPLGALLQFLALTVSLGCQQIDKIADGAQGLLLRT